MCNICTYVYHTNRKISRKINIKAIGWIEIQNMREEKLNDIKHAQTLLHFLLRINMQAILAVHKISHLGVVEDPSSLHLYKVCYC